MNTFDQQRIQRQQQTRLEQDMKLIETPVVKENERSSWEQRDQGKEKNSFAQNVPVEDAKFGETSISKMKDEERLGSNSDAMRTSVKLRLADLSKRYRETAGDNREFKKILDEIDAYTKIDATAVQASDVKKEQKTIEAIKSRLMAFIQTLITKTENGAMSGNDKDLMEKSYRLFGFFEGQKNGYLPKPPMNSKVVSAVGNDAFQVSERETMEDVSKLPLFSHEPSISDIRQGGLGDCYMLASLAAIVTQYPEKIKECMRDNMDGTVTVRFFEKSETGAFSPVYVTVDKKVPMNGSLDNSGLYASDCIWVQMMERAYAASNIHQNIKAETSWSACSVEELTRMRDSDAELRGFDSKTLDEKKTIYAGKSAGLFTVEYQDNDKHKPIVDIKLRQDMRPEYSRIAGGYSGTFIQVLLGDGYEKTTFKPIEETKGNNFYADSFSNLLCAQKPDTFPQEVASSDAVKVALFSTGIIQQFAPMPDFSLPATDQTRVAYTAQSTLIRNMKILYNCIGQRLGALDDAQHEENNKEVLLGENLNGIIDEALNEYRQRKGDVNIAEAQQLADYFKRMLREKGHQFSKCKTLSGSYDSYHEELYSKIEDAVSQGKIVSFDTPKMEDSTNRGLNGETTGVGVVGTHAYSIIGTQTRIVSGKTYKFVVARNPWGNRSRQYYKKDGEIKYRQQNQGEQGVFLIEISDFSKLADNLFING